MVGKNDGKKVVLLLASFAPSLILFRGPMIAAMIRAGHKVVAVAPDMDSGTSDQVKALGADCRSIPLARTGLNPVQDLAYMQHLRSIIRNVRPDVVLSYTAKPVIWGSIAARFEGVPLRAAMITGLGFAFTSKGIKQRLLGAVMALLYRTALDGCSTIFFQNPDDEEIFLKKEIVRAGKSIIINGSGVDTELFQPTPLPAAPKFLMLARILHSKGVAEYCEAAAKVRAVVPDAEFKLAGWIEQSPDSITQDDLKRLLGEDVIYLGVVTDVQAAITEASIYVLPSYREGTPRSVLEAMAMGRPVITTDAPGCRETVIDGQNGFLVPIKDSQTLAERMEKLAFSPDLRRIMGEKSRRLAVDRYDVRKVNEQILEALSLA